MRWIDGHVNIHMCRSEMVLVKPLIHKCITSPTRIQGGDCIWLLVQVGKSGPLKYKAGNSVNSTTNHFPNTGHFDHILILGQYYISPCCVGQFVPVNWFAYGCIRAFASSLLLSHCWSSCNAEYIIHTLYNYTFTLQSTNKALALVFSPCSHASHKSGLNLPL